jgi:hypothetical protein
MTITRSGSTKKYSDNWSKAFGKSGAAKDPAKLKLVSGSRKSAGRARKKKSSSRKK